MNPSIALRDGRWALIAETNDARRPKTHPIIAVDMPFIKSSKPEKFMLFDLESELTQQTDVSSQNPEVFERLKKMMINMHADVLSDSPYWEIPESNNSNKTQIWDSY